MRSRRNSVLAWALFGLVVVAGVATTIFNLVNPPNGKPLALSDHLWSSLIPLTFAFVGALITSHQPRNLIGLLLILPALALVIPLDTYLQPFHTAPESPSLFFLLALWFSNWGWLLLIIPLLFIILFFPTGRPPGPRWRWVTRLGLTMAGLFILLVTFSEELGPVERETEGTWAVRNPIGFITSEWFETYFIVPWAVALPALTLLCVASMIVRYRRAGAIEREQIKWLLYACAVFAVAYVPLFFVDDRFNADTVFGALFPLGVLAIPTAVGIAVLRYRLYDIEVIIRRTLQYALVTGLLALAYFGGVVILQRVLGPLTGRADSPLVVTIITLAIAALFNPLRRRVQRFVDRRFYRSRYDAELALARFAVTVRDEVDMDRLSAVLVGVVGETMQPDRIGLWLRPAAGGKKGSGTG